MPRIDKVSPAAEWVDIATVKPWPKNPKGHTATSTALLAAGIRRFGFLVPLTVRRSDGMIAGGHGRLYALQAILKESPAFVPTNAPKDTQPGAVPVLFADFETEAQFEAFVISDNQHPKNAATDDDAIAEMMRAMDADGFSLDGMGFDDEAIDLLIKGAAAVGDDEWGNAMGGLPEGDRAPIQTMTFTLHDDQAETVKAALAAARSMGEFVDTGNENGNGNAIARVCETFMAGR